MIAAARIQRMTRLFGVHIIVAEETFREVCDRVRYRELGTPRLKGIRDRTPLYEIQDVAATPAKAVGRA